ncbi:tyrosine-protein phosphatase [Terricaulis silvestris]|uniref:tyrosine-protein phosphatase n=1 Tax=Terricaulis silvestris TaxID=2686094 RepID=UPI00131D5202|nr:tyrosine-protein phosphatase [Terricaulis silvestris]
MNFDRILNFRDFGGWDTAAGGRIARGKLYRSASFHDATDADIARLNAMDLRFVVDLRRPEERAHEPTKWSNENCRVIFNDEGAGGSSLPPHLVALLQSDLTPQATRAYMLSLYREIPYDPRLIRLYRDWFAALGEGGAGVVHCAAGKDRTGIICALTLMTLGVDEETVFADYDFTNQAVDIEKRMPKIQARMEERLARKLDPAALRPMLGVEIDYLRAALDEIAFKHGGVDAYLADVLGVGAAERESLRAQLTV